MALTKKYDPIFRAHGHGLPIGFLRALGEWESSLNPNEHDGGAWGLLQVVPVVRKDYNKAHGTGYTQADMLDPVKNVKVATWLLDLICRTYAKRFRGKPHMVPNWDDFDFVKLLVHAWNAGWSMSGGVGKVALWMGKHRPNVNVGLQRVGEYAAAAGAADTLLGSTGEKKRAWARKVAITAMREMAAEKKSPESDSPPVGESSSDDSADTNEADEPDAGESIEGESEAAGSSSRRRCSLWRWLRSCVRRDSAKGGGES